MGIVVAVVVVALVSALVALRRSQAARWDTADASLQTSSFRKVWLRTSPPRASLSAYRDRVSGALVVDPSRRVAVLTGGEGQSITIKDVIAVRKTTKGSDFVNTWIEVHCGDRARGTIVFVHDGAWFGWRALLTGSNHRLVSALRSLITEEGRSGE